MTRILTKVRIHEWATTIKGFTEKYDVRDLVHFEHFEGKWDAANRERMLKNWKRQWKIDLIEKENPEWVDLYETL